MLPSEVQGIAHSSRVDHQIQSPSDLQHSLRESFFSRSVPQTQLEGTGKVYWSLMCPFWPAQRSSLQSCMFQVLAESSFTCLKRWVSFTRGKPLHSLMVGHLAFQSWPQKPSYPMEGQIPKPRMVGKEKGTEKNEKRGGEQTTHIK